MQRPDLCPVEETTGPLENVIASTLIPIVPNHAPDRHGDMHTGPGLLVARSGPEPLAPLTGTAPPFYHGNGGRPHAANKRPGRPALKDWARDYWGHLSITEKTSPEATLQILAPNLLAELEKKEAASSSSPSSSKGAGHKRSTSSTREAETSTSMAGSGVKAEGSGKTASSTANTKNKTGWLFWLEGVSDSTSLEEVVKAVAPFGNASKVTLPCGKKKLQEEQGANCKDFTVVKRMRFSEGQSDPGRSPKAQTSVREESSEKDIKSTRLKSPDNQTVTKKKPSQNESSTTKTRSPKATMFVCVQEEGKDGECKTRQRPTPESKSAVGTVERDGGGERSDGDKEESSDGDKEEISDGDMEECSDGDKEGISDGDKEGISGGDKEESYNGDKEESSDGDKEESYNGDKEGISDGDEESYNGDKEGISDGDEESYNGDKEESSDEMRPESSSEPPVLEPEMQLFYESVSDDDTENETGSPKGTVTLGERRKEQTSRPEKSTTVKVESERAALSVVTKGSSLVTTGEQPLTTTSRVKTEKEPVAKRNSQRSDSRSISPVRFPPPSPRRETSYYQPYHCYNNWGGRIQASSRYSEGYYSSYERPRWYTFKRTRGWKCQGTREGSTDTQY